MLTCINKKITVFNSIEIDFIISHFILGIVHIKEHTFLKDLSIYFC